MRLIDLGNLQISKKSYYKLYPIKKVLECNNLFDNNISNFDKIVTNFLNTIEEKDLKNYTVFEMVINDKSLSKKDIKQIQFTFFNSLAQFLTTKEKREREQRLNIPNEVEPLCYSLTRINILNMINFKTKIDIFSATCTVNGNTVAILSK